MTLTPYRPLNSAAGGGPEPSEGRRAWSASPAPRTGAAVHGRTPGAERHGEGFWGVYGAAWDKLASLATC